MDDSPLASWSRRTLALTLPALFATKAVAAPSRAAETLLGPGALYGWAALDLSSGRRAAVNPDLRLPMCSSFKWLLAAAILSRAEAGSEDLRREIAFGPKDLVFNSPTVEAAVKGANGSARLPVEKLCEATVTLSDSAAANLLLNTLGGPAGLTRWLRQHGDAVTRLDRAELDLNRVPPGDPRDTTTPVAMMADLHHLLFGPGLTPASKARLSGWLLAAKPGATRMPAGLRPGWRIGHKTGTWMVDSGHGPQERAACGDVAFLLPPGGGRPMLIAAYTAGSERPQAEVDHWFAELVREITGPDGFARHA